MTPPKGNGRASFALARIDDLDDCRFGTVTDADPARIALARPRSHVARERPRWHVRCAGEVLVALKMGRDRRKEIVMPSPSQGIVYHLLASHLGVDEASIENAETLDALGLDPLDLVLVVIRLEDLGGEGDFPMAALAHAMTVADLVDLVDVWLKRETSPSGIDARRSRRTSAA